ncbi:MAG: EAL domain-containing protein, partial [Hyphomicrobiaceae bacterium]
MSAPIELETVDPRSSAPGLEPALGAPAVAPGPPKRVGGRADGKAAGSTVGSASSLISILTAVQETAYTWTFADDVMVWEANAAEVLGTHSIRGIATGAAFQFLIAPEHIERRHSAVAQHVGSPVEDASGYRIQYRFMPGGRRCSTELWLEEHGVWQRDEAGNVVSARGVVRVINERYSEEQRLLYRSDHDELTGQLNRVRFIEALGAVIDRAKSSGQSCALLIAAVDNLAAINKAFGFEVGDQTISAVGRQLRSHLRGGDTLGRYSSNKFGIVLNECGPGAMRLAAERLMRSVRDMSIQTSVCQLSATISAGGVMLPDQAGTVNAAVSRALEALEKIKQRRQDRFLGYEHSTSQESERQRNIKIADEVINALNENRILAALQPVVRASNQEIAFYECLLRLEQPDGSIIAAGEFIHVAEQLGLSRPIDRRALELAIGLLKLDPSLHLAINVSGLTTADHEWLVALHRLTGGKKHLTERLTVEITETAAIEDLDQSITFVDTLKELGCRVAIDDFGAGYTSFRNLKCLGAGMVKIDGAFARNLCEDETDRIFMKTMIELATSCGMETVAECVGDAKTGDMLRSFGVTYMQG